MLKNAHIRSMDSALMRALAAVPSVQQTPRMTLEDKFIPAIELSRMSGGFR